MAKAVSIALTVVLAAALSAQELVEEPLVYIEGVVVDQASKEPVSGARVSGNMAGSLKHFVTHTDSSGRFRLRDLASGDYSIVVERRGYLSYFQGRLRRSPAHLTLRRGMPIEDLRIKIRRPGVLTGRVEDENAEPFTGVRVRALCVASADDGEPCRGSGSAEADDRGFFRIFGLEPGRYLVSAKAPRQGYGATTYQPALDDPDGERLKVGYLTTYYPYGFDRSQASLVDVISGSETGGIEIRLEPAKTLAVSGQVINPYKPKGIRANVALRSFSGAIYLESHNQSYQDMEGYFAFDGLPPGEYLLTTDYENGGVRVADWLQFELTDSSLDGVELRPRPGVTVSGRVSLDDPETQLNELAMYVRVKQEGILGNIMDRSEGTALDGRFSIGGVLPGRYQVSASAYDWVGQRYYTEAVSLDSRPVPEEGLLVSGDSPISSLEIRVARTVSLRGLVIGRDLTPVSAALVVVASPDPEGGFSDHTTTLTNDEGRFHMRHLVPGEGVAFAFQNKPDGRKITNELLRTLKPRGRKVEFNRDATDEIELNVIDRPDP